jgi:hypothetical protein
MEETQKYETEPNDIAKFEDRSESMPVPVNESITSIMQIAIQKNYAPEFIEKMMDLQERHEANQAKRAFHIAMAKFKANPPKIWRDIQVKYEVGTKTTEWSHADLATAGEAISKALGENGLNSTWRTLPLDNNKVRVTCIIAHELGHSEETYLESGPDTTGSKNAIQALGSAVFYLERYTLFALTGLAPARMDDDGKNVGGKIDLLEQWTIKCDEAGNNAKSADDVAAWWKQNSSVIKKELSKANAAKIYAKVNIYNKKLMPEPGSAG